jgi:eukaryotic-like serine/threonine-protein kinase
VTESDEQQARARAAREALVGKMIAGRYVLRGLLGHGGMGAVYEAELLGLGKRYAIKFVDPEFATDETVVARFAREAKAMSTVESPHIVTVFDAGTEDGRPYLVMELLRGEDLGQRLRKEVRIPLGESMHVVAQVLKGLARAHAAGIIHRDLKPDNVFLVKGHTDPLFAKIVDFGISKIERPRASTTPLALTGRGTVLGTPFYMSPEQAQASSDVDARADLYSVGAILFECLTGRPPHTGESYEQVILSICMRDAPDVRAVDPKLSPEVSKFVARALARERDQRFASAERMLAGLHEVAPEEKTRVPLDPTTPVTMMSPGMPISVKTQIGVADLAPVSPRAPSPSQPDPTPALVPVSASLPMPMAMQTPPPQAAHSMMTAGPSSVQARKKRSATLLVTAGIALVIGVVASIAIVVAMDKKPSTEAQQTQAMSATAPSAASSTPPTITSAVTSSAPVVVESVAPPSSAPPSGVIQVIAKPNPTQNPTPKPKPNGTPTGSAGKLDIQRDLP